MRLNDTHFIYLHSIFVCLVYMWHIRVCTCVDVGIHTYAEMQIILGVIFYHFLLCVLSHTALNLELMITAGWLASASPRSARVGLVITVHCHACFLCGWWRSKLSKKHSTYWAVSLTFIRSFVRSFVHSSKTRLAQTRDPNTSTFWMFKL